MTSPLERSSLARSYRQHLEQVILPFWLDGPADTERGGVFTCIDNRGERRVSDDKFVWSQGRFTWLMARAARLAHAGLIDGKTETYLGLARKTADFLARHAFLDNGRCVYLLTADGRKKEFLLGEGHDISFFADCFVTLGFTEFTRVSGDDTYLDKALCTYDGIREQLAVDKVRSEPYPIPPGCHAHSFPMIMLNVSQELERLLAARTHPRADELAHDALANMDHILTTFRQEDNVIAEVVCKGGKDRLLTRHLTPGHAIESMWFVMEEAQRHGRHDALEQAVAVIKRSFELGWDREHGGLFRFVGRDGTPPLGPARDRFEQLILDTWDTKIWWPHSETLYSTLLGYLLTGDVELLDIHRRVHEYTFATFPNPDTSVGEWIQIRDREGQPVDKLVGLPVKDPYHIMRNLMLLVELLERGPEVRIK